MKTFECPRCKRTEEHLDSATEAYCILHGTHVRMKEKK